MCKISIIIPIYNVEDFLEKCLLSIQKQTFTDYEVIMIDDGSKDGSGLICDRFAEADPRFRVIHKKNEGVSIARNTAIVQAKGEYIAFFDGDDYVKPECLQEVYDTAKANDADSVIFGYYLVEDGKIIETHLPSFEKEIYSGEELIEKVVPKFVGVSYEDMNRWCQGKKGALKKENTALWHQLVKTSVLMENEIRFDKNLKVGEDTCFTTEYLSASRKCCIINKCYYHLVVRSTSTIFMYEKDPFAVLKGKTALLKGRRELTERIKSRSGKDIEPLWCGSVIFSIVQLGLQLGRTNKEKSYKERYQLWLAYINHEETQNAIHNLNLKGSILKRMPFYMIKWKWNRLLFAILSAAARVKVSIKR